MSCRLPWRRAVAFLAAALPALVAAHAAGAQQIPDLEVVDEVFADYDEEGHPGCAVGIYQEGELALSRGYGEANLDWGIPISDSTVFYIGSVSKQFAAATAVLLHLDGTLHLDTDVRRLIPELPSYGEPVTVRQLVHHTSGVRDIYGVIRMSGGRTADAWTDREYVELLANQATLNHEPGTDYLYSNGGYFLLTTAIERATGMSLDEAAREHIFEPLGMDDTHFHQDRERIVPRRAMSYRGNADDGFRQTYLGNFDKAGAGGLYTTIRDMEAWDRNFSTGEVGGEGFVQLMKTRGLVAGGDTLSYAMGIRHGVVEDRPTFGHGGSFMGFRADYLRFADEDIGVATFCNLGGINPGGLSREVAEAIFENAPADGAVDAGEGAPVAPHAQKPRDEDGNPVSPAADNDGDLSYPAEAPSVALREFEGRYHSAEMDNTVHVHWDGEELRLRQSEAGDTSALEWRGADRFQAGGLGGVEFQVEDGRVEALVVDAGRVREIRFERRGR